MVAPNKLPSNPERLSSLPTSTNVSTLDLYWVMLLIIWLLSRLLGSKYNTTTVTAAHAMSACTSIRYFPFSSLGNKFYYVPHLPIWLCTLEQLYPVLFYHIFVLLSGSSPFLCFLVLTSLNSSTSAVVPLSIRALLYFLSCSSSPHSSSFETAPAISVMQGRLLV